jgi:hypothetical protein
LKITRPSAKGIALGLGISRPVVQDIIHHDLKLQKVKAHWVPKLQSIWDKATRRLWAESFLLKYEGDWLQFKGRFITCDETWLLYEEPETKETVAEWRAPGEEPPVIPKIKKVQRKVMGLFFWDAQGIIMVDYVSTSRRVTGNYYADLIHQLIREADHKRPQSIYQNIYKLYHNIRKRHHTAA